MKNMPELLVLAYRKASLQAIVEHLDEVGLSNHCKIVGVLVEDIDAIYSPDLVLATNQSVYNMGKKFIDQNTPYMIAKRSINFANIKKLLSLPRGSRVYIVNNMKEAAEETINTLTEVGILHRYIPYYGQKNIDLSITTAVTPGEVDLVPQSIKNVINIGHRLLDMTTLFDIYEFFGISTFASNNQLSARYIQSIVSLTDDLNRQIIQTRGLHKSLEGIVDQIEEGLLVYDETNTIISINMEASRLLKKENSNLLHEHIKKLPSHFYDAFMEVEMEKENFINIQDIPYYIRKKRIFLETKVFATIIIFEKVDRIKNIETRYRHSTHNKAFVAKHTFSDIKTNSQNMKNLIEKARRMARSNSTIFIQGETGTGKEVMAQAIHSVSDRSQGPFVAVNLAAIPDSLAESELFGYEKGAFTGARKDGNAGLFEKAHRGTIFLDEIGDASPSVQNRLLRVLQEREVQRVGGGHPIPVDIRVIAATNKNLPELISEREFRQDLYYRLNILPINLIPLRQRREDILLLSELFIKEFEEKLQRRTFSFSDAAIESMLHYEWPGNVRELRNMIEYLAHICKEKVNPEDLPFYAEEPILQDDEQHDAHTLKQLLEEKGFLNDCKQILHVFNKMNGQGIGRYRLLKILTKYNEQMSEQMLRYRLEILSQFNLINVSQGRGGSTLNYKGKRFLLYLEKTS